MFSVRLLLTAAPAILFIPTASAQLDIPLLEGDILPGSDGTAISDLNHPFTNGLGKIGLTASLDSGDRGIIFDDDFIWLNSFEKDFTLAGAEGSMGISDTGGFIYSPSINGDDGVWTQLGLLLREGDPAPGVKGQNTTFCSRPTMTPVGTAYWISGIGPATSTNRRVLYEWDGDTITPLLIGGQEFDGQFISDDGIGFDYQIADKSVWRLVELSLSAPTTSNAAVALNDTIIAREGSPTGDGDLWQNFDVLAVNDAGDYAFSGDTNAATSADEFIAVNGTIVLREGDVIAGVTLGSAVSALSINNNRQVVYVWSTTSSTQEALFFANDIDDIPGSSIILAQTGDQIDRDDDASFDYEITDFNLSVTGPAINFAEDGFIHFNADLDDLEDVGTNVEGIVSVPHCRADLDGDRIVGFSDLVLLLSAWGPCASSDCLADLTLDADVGFDDLVLLLSVWGPCPR